MHGGLERRRALNLERDNFLKACRQALVRQDGETATGALLAACVVIFQRGPQALAARLASEVLELDSLTPVEHAWTLETLARARRYGGHLEEARVLFESALTAYCELGDRHGEAVIRNFLGDLHVRVGPR